MRVGIIGTGWGVRTQAPAFQAAGLTVVGLAGRNPEKTAAAVHKLQLQAFPDWQALLASDVELVSIATPPATHREMALAALAAGKHVLCEKPTALNAAEARAMRDAAGQHPNQITLIDHELRFLPIMQAARTIVQRGELGKLRHITSSVISGRRSDPTRAWDWWSDRSQGGGLWGAIGSHQIDTLRFLYGEIAAVSAVLNTFIVERPFEGSLRAVTADDFATAQLRFVDGGVGSLTLSLVAAVDEPNELTLYGEAGTLRITGEQLMVAQRGGWWQDCTPADTLSLPSALRHGSDFDRGTIYLGHALNAFSSGNRAAIALGATFEDGLRNQAVLDAGCQSHANNGGWIMVERN